MNTAPAGNRVCSTITNNASSIRRPSRYPHRLNEWLSPARARANNTNTPTRMRDTPTRLEGEKEYKKREIKYGQSETRKN